MDTANELNHPCPETPAVRLITELKEWTLDLYREAIGLDFLSDDGTEKNDDQ